jgi:diguanylate cyclase (GGDEF)-like protein
MTTKQSKLLLVDDSRIGLMHMVQILQDEYQVFTASSGVEAVQMAVVAKPDLILMDIVMPQMDGYEALALMRETLETKDIPVIFISSLDQDINEEKALRLGAVDYIFKPYNPMIVKLRINVQLRIVNQVRRILEQSLVDTVTNLPSKQYFNMRVKDEWIRAGSNRYALGVMMVGVDNMKNFNRQYGIIQGDKMLHAVAKVVSDKAILKPGDVAARWAEDIFITLSLDTGMAHCNMIGENIRSAVEDTVIKNSAGVECSTTVSVGVHTVEPSDISEDLEEFITKAEEALYLAKELGRNQVVAASLW